MNVIEVEKSTETAPFYIDLVQLPAQVLCPHRPVYEKTDPCRHRANGHVRKDV